MNAIHSARERGRPRAFDRDNVLDRAMILFRQRGYHAASMADLSQAMQLTTGSIYKAFSDKQTLFAQVFSRYLSLRNAALRDRLAGCASGREKMLALLNFYLDSVRDIEGERGCLVVASVAELQVLDDELSDAVIRAMQRNQQTLAAVIREGQQDGSISPALDVTQTASLMLCIVLGMRVAGKVAATRPDEGIVPLALSLLDRE